MRWKDVPLERGLSFIGTLLTLLNRLDPSNLSRVIAIAKLLMNISAAVVVKARDYQTS